jgi:3',5'-cyclic AMP phosphodiesterase CpdA
MKTIAHISDLHFGRADARVCEALLADLEALRPGLVAVSGDLTQRARRREFAEARAFLGRISSPVLVVPGNHDVPLYDVMRRFASPLARYRRYITNELNPLWIDDEMAVLGINTARSLTFSNGRISVEQVAHARRRLCAVPPDHFKAVVTHHGFLAAPGDPSGEFVGRAPQALRALEACGVELLLAGHAHVSWTGDVRSTHTAVRRAIVVVQAGTAMSTRTRDEANSFNVVTVGDGRLSVVVREWTGAAFVDARRTDLVRRGHEWLADGAS